MTRRLLVLLFALAVCVSVPKMMAQTRFQRMDRDQDERLSRSEFKGPPAIFRRLDRNNDGYISSQEAVGTRLSAAPEQNGMPKSRSLAEESSDLVFVDTHNHLVGPKVMDRFNLERPTRIALQAMDSVGVKLCFLMPMPQAVGQTLRLRLEDLLPTVKQYPNRFAALGGGGTLNVMIQQAVKDGKVTGALEKEFDARALELVRQGAVGFGEMTAEHFAMGGEHPYETASPDHPLFLRLADLAAEHSLPIDLHMEAIPVEMPMPARFESPPNPRVLKPNIAAFERMLAHNRKAKIIWVHLGWDNTGRRTIFLTRRLLAENPNLYMSIRIASGMQDKGVVKPTFPLDKVGQLKPEWLDLFQEFPDRFLIGSDEIIKPANDHASAGSIRSTVSMLQQLPSELRSQIGYENAYRLYKLPRQ